MLIRLYETLPYMKAIQCKMSTIDRLARTQSPFQTAFSEGSQEREEEAQEEGQVETLRVRRRGGQRPAHTRCLSIFYEVMIQGVPSARRPGLG